MINGKNPTEKFLWMLKKIQFKPNKKGDDDEKQIRVIRPNQINQKSKD
mgnify:CR=1 FL=1